MRIIKSVRKKFNLVKKERTKKTVTMNPSWSVSGNSLPGASLNLRLMNEPKRSPACVDKEIINPSEKSTLNNKVISNPALSPKSRPSKVLLGPNKPEPKSSLCLLVKADKVQAALEK